MHSLEELLAAAALAPDDDAPRLVLQDALLERKDPRGELLALQFKQARLADSACRGISLNLNSSLYAVGLLAAVSEVLAKAAMSINIVSAFHRDYIFVPASRAEEAVELLKKLAKR